MTRFLAALAVAVALPLAAQAQEGGDAPATLTVSGEASVSAAPDMATIRAGVETDGATAAEALTANSRQATDMIAALKDAGVAPEDLQTGTLRLEPRYADMQRTRPGEPPEVVGYRAVNEVVATIRDLDGMGAAIDQVVRAGANRINAIRFGLSDDTALADEARGKAVADARRRAEVLAEAAGVGLGRVLSIADGGGGPRPVPGMMMRAEAMDAPIERGEVGVQASVSMVWEIAEQE